MQLYGNSGIRPDSIPSDAQTKRVSPQTVGGSSSFQDVFHEQLQRSKGLQFSKHANQRLTSREIQMTPNQLKRVEDGVSKAKDKGISDSLVIVDNIALVVNVASQKVITALGKDDKDRVFTNIDGAVIV